MKTIVLPGFSPKNKEWAYEVKDNVKLDSPIIVHEWIHWKTGSSGLSLKKEIDSIIKLVGNEDVNFISKSVGTRVTVNLLTLIGKRIKKIVFCGIPLRGFGKKTKDMFKKELSSFLHQNIIIFQNVNDPWGNFIVVNKFIKGINNEIKVVEKERSDHNYPYYKEVEEFLKK